MNNTRIENVLKRSKADAILVSDPTAIYYLIGKRIYPGERFLALVLRRDQKPVLFLNNLFPFEEDEQVKVVRYNDGDNVSDLLSPYIGKDEVLGVDKMLVARFLLPMQQAKLAKEFIDGSIAIDKTRAVKDEHEKELMRKSSAINDAAMERFKKLVYEGVTEKEVADQTLDIYKELGAEGFSFPSIVAFGKNSADPHHMPDDTKLQVGDAVLFDVGCTYKGYCSDMTRTFFFKKGPSEKQRQVYELVKKANEDATKAVKAGVRLCDIDKTARDVIENGGYGKFFTHRLGHFIGIEDHEYGDVSAAFKDLTETDNIFSIEPGIYDPDTLGCRIEDLVIVTDEGCEVLNHYPHEIEIIG
ncbi:MAG: aminopeptidase P family protein [Erysipelotrichaceae bacterium]|nr:aminopeptidase P family protein [Erysipelotrichaceae bacterium]